MGTRLWRVYLATGVVALCVFAAVPRGVAEDVVYLAIGLSGVAAIAVGARRCGPQHATPWRLMGVGQLIWVLGDTVDSWRQDVLHVQTYPSVSDLLYLAAYPLLAVGLLLLIRGRLPRRDIAGLLDSATLTTGLGLLSWVLLARPTFEASQYSWSAATVGLAYPLADIVLAGLLIRLVTTPGGRTPSFRWLLTAVTLLIGADTAYSALSLWSTSDLHLLNFIWPASYIAWGVAALHPSMTTLSEPTRSQDVRFTGTRLVALGAASLVAPGTLAVEKIIGSPIDVWTVVVGSVVMFLLVVSRMSVAIRQIVAANHDRERLQRNLVYQAAHDALTDLPNRVQALNEIEAALSRAQRTGSMLGMLFLDLDGFKVVNDTYGHHAGDEVLRIVAARLQELVRAGDLVARLGDDEFVMLLESLTSESEALVVAKRIIEQLPAPIAISGGGQACVGASIGMAISRDGSTDAQRMLHEADTAGHRAKTAGRGRVEVFDQALRRELVAQADLESALATAMSNDELVLHYQPITQLGNDTIHGYEALVRWQRPGQPLVPPDSFIPTAEKSNLICELDRWVLDHATKQLAQWMQGGMPTRTVAVNISGRHVGDPRIVDEVKAALAASGLPPGQLILEITETVLIEDLRATDHLTQLRALGVAISIDDFGTGYNSMSRLQHLPVDIIKIDRSFLDNTNKFSHALLTLIVATAHTFGLPVVAEGVEDQEQLTLLRDLSCEYAQGFLLSRPLTVDQILAAEAGSRVGSRRRRRRGPPVTVEIDPDEPVHASL